MFIWFPSDKKQENIVFVFIDRQESKSNHRTLKHNQLTESKTNYIKVSQLVMTQPASS